jgi:redox-sensing transcriptional repressor
VQCLNQSPSGILSLRVVTFEECRIFHKPPNGAANSWHRTRPITSPILLLGAYPCIFAPSIDWRKDLSHFGGFGKQGTGYQIAYLQDKLRQVLKVNQEWEIALIGAGDLGTAIANYRGFGDRGFHIALVFDAAPKRIGQKISDFTVQSINEMQDAIRERGIKIAMIAVPAEYAQEVADRLIEAGIKGILNYAPINLNVPEDVQVQYIDPVIHLQRMTYYIPEY